MRLVDANVLLYAANRDAPHHDRASGWMNEALSGRSGVGFAWVALLAFLRLSTRPGLFPRPLTTSEAHDVIDLWLGQPSATVLQPTSRHPAILRRLLAEAHGAGNLVTDAHLAALAIEHKAEIVTFDSDFERFPGVRRVEP